MTGLGWWLVEQSARALDSAEREVVLGDLAESHASTGRALTDVLGLVVRRQAACWRGWRPWLAMATVVLPLGMLLSLVSRGVADASAIDAFFYVNNWTRGYLESPGARGDLSQRAVSVSLNYLTLALWSGATGYVLGSLSRRALPATSLLFCLVLFLFEKLLTGARYAHGSGNSAVFTLPIYGVVLPVVVQSVLVLTPAVWAMRQRERLRRAPLLPAAIGAAAMLGLTARATTPLTYWVGWAVPPWSEAWVDASTWVLPALLLWPVGYVLALVSVQRRRVRTDR